MNDFNKGETVWYKIMHETRDAVFEAATAHIMWKEGTQCHSVCRLLPITMYVTVYYGLMDHNAILRTDT